MKIFAMVAMAALAGTASAQNIEMPAAAEFAVCVETSGFSVPIQRAERLASTMFATAGVTIEWRTSDECPADGIRVSLSRNAPASYVPGAFAYALAYEGTHIVVFCDRIAGATDLYSQAPLLAHVLVHEVTHILEGVSRHSETGIMKARFGRVDIAGMALRSLPFAAEDVQLIHSGKRVRQAQITSGVNNGPGSAE